MSVSVAVTLLGLGCGYVGTDHKPGNSTAVVDQVAPRDDYPTKLAVIDRKLADARAIASERQGWADHELAARLWVRRARLTGSIDDWAAADQALAAGFAHAPPGGGPVLSRLELDSSLHRLADAERRIAQLEAAPMRTAKTNIHLALARGDLASQRGELELARLAFEQAEQLGADGTTLAGRYALLAGKQGAPEQALEILERTRSETPSGQASAWLWLQTGLVEWGRDRPAAALERYDAAEAAFPGWWLVTEHRAEALVALGRLDEAEQLYRGVIETTGHPEFMDALADLLGRDGRDEEAKTWVARARAEHERRLALLPSAVGAHALDHLLRYAPDDPRTIELAHDLGRGVGGEPSD